MPATQERRDFLADAAALLGAARAATLATVRDGMPNAALVTPALTADGAPLLLLSNLAVHTQQLQAHPSCALLVTGAAAGDNPQTAPRLCLQARATVTEAAASRARYLDRHPYAALYAGFTDFALWRLDVLAAQYIGGFAQAARLDPEALRQRILAAAG